jgi:hypothetical protein
MRTDCIHNALLVEVIVPKSVENKDFRIIVNRGHPDYDLYNPLMPEKGRYVVLMFVDNHTKGNLEIEYQIIDREGQESPRIASLTTRGRLPYVVHDIRSIVIPINKNIYFTVIFGIGISQITI